MKKLIWLSIIVLFICGCHRHISMDKISYFPPQEVYQPHIFESGKSFQSKPPIYMWADDEEKIHFTTDPKEIPSYFSQWKCGYGLWPTGK